MGLWLASASLGTTRAEASLWPDVSERVRADLASPEVARRRAAAEALGSLPLEASRPLFEAALADPDLDVRLIGAQSAARAGVDVADRLLPWLTDPELRLREGACMYFTRRPQGKVIKVVSRALGDSEVRVRLAAVRALGASGSTDAVAPLLARLDDVSSKVRQEVARALSRLGDRRAVTPLVSKISDEAPEVRQSVVRTLGDLGDPRAAPALGIALRDAANEVRLEALASLGRLRAADAVASIAPLVFDARRAGGNDTRRAALGALGRIGSPAAVDAIVRAFGLDDDEGAGLRASAAREAAVRAGDVATPTLLALLRDGVPPTLTRPPGTRTPSAAEVLASAAYAIAALHAPGASEAVERALRRGDLAPVVAMRALGVLGDSSSLTTCLEQVNASDAETRREALAATARMLDPEHPDGRAVEPLLASLARAQDELALAGPGAESRSLETAAEIARLLGRTGAARALPVLIGLTTSKASRLRLAAVEALGTLGDPGAGATLVKLIDDPDGEVRMRAGIALGRAGGGDVLSATVDRATGTRSGDRMAVAVALMGMMGRIGDERSVGRLLEALPAAGVERDLSIVAATLAPKGIGGAAIERWAATPGLDVDARRALAVGLGARHGDVQAVRRLRQLASDADATVRAQAVWALGAVSEDPADALSLARAISEEPAMAVAANAVAALGRLSVRLPATGSSSPPAAICSALGDARPYVRADALAALTLLQRAGRGSECAEDATSLAALERDPDEVVRAFAARFLANVAAPATGERALRARAALDRCAIAETSGAVAARCREVAKDDADHGAAAAASPPLVIVVVPDDGGAPVPRSAYAVERSDGLLHVGTSDRRGAVVELALVRGDVRLRVPVPPLTARE